MLKEGWERKAMMERHFAIIRDGKEITRITAHHYTQEIIPRRITFYDAHGAFLDAFTPQVGDVVKPVVFGFHNPSPPIDQSPARIHHLTEKLRELEATERFWATARDLGSS
jgi:hypothetical protein